MIFKSVLLYMLMFGMIFYTGALSSVFDLKLKFGSTLDESHTLATKVPVSLKQCYDACLARVKCLAIEFRRLFRLCRLLSSDSNTAGVQLIFAKGTVYSEKSDWTKKYPDIGCQDCKTEETCLVNNNEVTCKQSECSKPELLDIQSMILGSEVSVGSRILHKCKYIANVSAESVCETNGQWSNESFKCPLGIDGKTYKIISSQDNRWWYYNGNGDKNVSSTYQTDDTFANFAFLKQLDGFYKIQCTGLGEGIYDVYSSTNPESVLQHLTTTPDEDNMRYEVTIVSENFYRIKTKATGRFVRLDPDDGFVSSRYNLEDNHSLFWFEEIQLCNDCNDV